MSKTRRGNTSIKCSGTERSAKPFIILLGRKTLQNPSRINTCCLWTTFISITLFFNLSIVFPKVFIQKKSTVLLKKTVLPRLIIFSSKHPYLLHPDKTVPACQTFLYIFRLCCIVPDVFRIPLRFRYQIQLLYRQAVRLTIGVL